jgi:hypothetical protein
MRDVLNARDAPLSEEQIAFVCRESLQARAASTRSRQADTHGARCVTQR